MSASKIRGITVGNMLISASIYKIIDDREVKVCVEKTMCIREMFELFGVENPAVLDIAKVSERMQLKARNFCFLDLRKSIN